MNRLQSIRNILPKRSFLPYFDKKILRNEKITIDYLKKLQIIVKQSVEKPYNTFDTNNSLYNTRLILENSVTFLQTDNNSTNANNVMSIINVYINTLTQTIQESTQTIENLLESLYTKYTVEEVENWKLGTINSAHTLATNSNSNSSELQAFQHYLRSIILKEYLIRLKKQLDSSEMMHISFLTTDKILRLLDAFLFGTSSERIAGMSLLYCYICVHCRLCTYCMSSLYCYICVHYRLCTYCMSLLYCYICVHYKLCTYCMYIFVLVLNGCAYCYISICTFMRMHTLYKCEICTLIYTYTHTLLCAEYYVYATF